ncbi:hypothetical protein GBA52_027824 [Prunus armeniaca]|nr:hypothetical protein GBA52_027824 [Prunus armeniaca]
MKQLLLGFGPEMKDRSDSNTERVTASTSLNVLTTAIVSLSLLRDEKLDPLRFPIALWIAFFTIFLEVKYFLTSVVSAPDSLPRLLRMID